MQNTQRANVRLQILISPAHSVNSISNFHLLNKLGSQTNYESNKLFRLRQPEEEKTSYYLMLFEYLNKAFVNMSETYAYLSEEVGDRDVTTACFALRHRIRNYRKTAWNECSLIGTKMLYLTLCLFKTDALALVICWR